MLIDANVVPKITGSILRRPLQMDVCENVKYLCNNLQLADTLPSSLESSTKIEIQQELYLLGSKLGWILTGRSQLSDEERENKMTMTVNGLLSITECCLHSTIDTCLQIKPSIDDFWKFETIRIQDCPYTSDDENTLSKFVTSLKMENGRYQVAWTWKEKLPELPENRELAYGRLKSLFQKMKNNPDLLNKYDEIIIDQCKKGIIEKVSNQCSKDTGIKHNIQHHVVVDPTKPTTKVRIVYDASAESKQENKSLNDCLHRGIVMLQDLCGLLLPTLDYHLDTYKNATAANIRENIYLDNVITGVDSTENAVTLYKEATQIFSDASMNLREWVSNSQKFLECIPKEDQANREKLKVLGLTWTIKDDTLTVNSARNDNMFPVTKREVLQRVASVFDPLGFFTPVTLRTKLFLQMLWNKKMEWDEQLTEEDIQQWKEISFDLGEIQEYHIPRAIGLPAKLLAGEGPDGETNSVGNSKSSVGYLLDIDCSRFSSFIRLIRVSAWVLRFVKPLNKETISGPLTAAELEHAKLLLIKSVQKQCFGEVMMAIKENKRHNLVSQLGLILDQENVIRCVGRIGAAQLSEGAKTPILLPKKNKVTELLIESMHRKNFHVGVSQTLSAMRQTYWIPQGRSEVKRVLRKYNGSQFKLASKTLEEAWNGVTVDSGVQTYMANEGIQCQFIVELAPWMGGFYERLIGIVKRCLRKTIRKLCLTNEQFRTLLAESEAVVNSRPLVYIGDDINSNIILTPAHFLTLNAKTGFSDHNEEDSTDPEYLPQISSAKKLLLTWKKGQKHLNMFWKTWRDEYLLSLRERTANKLRNGRIQSKIPAKVGDIVLIKENLPRGSWKIGRICQLVVSRDGQIRSGKVMLPNKKTLNRALNMLYPIECEELDEGLKNSDTEKDTELINDNTSTTRERTQRQAARTAMKKIQEQLES
ncbi:unnamed protein product [Mytilus edulis]|uniref:Integrase catalytic domain-containing protein n=1 Tax=Mytilus edulis TaxID=6550 RepID=A0A8S3QU27_MYTED|nr:unnamed protein product [Mytilus edulis]